MRFILLSILLSSCIAIKEGCDTCEPVVIYKYVDIETYRTWGTKRLVPIGVREIPETSEKCVNKYKIPSGECND